MGRRIGISETPYTGIVEALNNVTTALNKIDFNLIYIRTAINLQTKYLELLTRKFSKKLFKRYFGKGSVKLE